MLGNLGSASLSLQPGGRQSIKLEGAKYGSYFKVKLARRDGASILPVADTRWPALRNNRSILIFHENADGNVSYRAVDEFLPPTPPDN